MDGTAFSIYAFGIYEIIAGLGFLFFPNLILSTCTKLIDTLERG